MFRFFSPPFIRLTNRILQDTSRRPVRPKSRSVAAEPRTSRASRFVTLRRAPVPTALRPVVFQLKSSSEKGPSSSETRSTTGRLRSVADRSQMMAAVSWQCIIVFFGIRSVEEHRSIDAIIKTSDYSAWNVPPRRHDRSLNYIIECNSNELSSRQSAHSV